jgi:hypothetical protein
VPGGAAGWQRDHVKRCQTPHCRAPCPGNHPHACLMHLVHPGLLQEVAHLEALLQRASGAEAAARAAAAAARAEMQGAAAARASAAALDQALDAREVRNHSGA